jgi:hypothetical protein
MPFTRRPSSPFARRAALAAAFATALLLAAVGRTEVPAATSLGSLATDVTDFLVSDVGIGGIRTNDNDPDGYPVPPYFYHYGIFDSNKLWSGGTEYPGYAAVSYPAYTASVAIDAFLDLRRWSGDPQLLQRARAFADWVLEHRTPAGDLYGNLPYSTQTDGTMGGGWDGPAIMTDKPAMFALRLLRLYDITGEPAYREAALEIADVLAATQLAGGPQDDGRWPFRVVPATGEVTQDYTSHLQPAVRLFDALAGRTGDPVYAQARDRAWAWLLANPCNPASPHYQRWEAFYEDQTPAMQVGERDHYSAHEMIVELVARRPAGWQELAATILDTTDARYLEVGPDSPYHPYEPVTLEWEGWPQATYASSFQYARTALLLHAALAGDPRQRDVWRTRALAMTDVMTHGQNDRGISADGRMFTTIRDLLYPYNVTSWYEQNFNTVKYALEIMALEPSLAPADQSHVLAADHGLVTIEYGRDGWAVRYATAGGSGRERVVLSGAPERVEAGGVELPELGSPDAPGPGWHWDASAHVLTVQHPVSPVAIRLATTAVAATAEPMSLRATGSGARLLLTVPAPAAVDLALFDLRGRRVRRLLAGAFLAAGEHAVNWNRCDQFGRPVASGVYVARLRSAGATRTLRFSVVR